MRSIIAVAIAVFVAGPAVAGKPRHLNKPVEASCISSPFGPRLIPNHPQAGTYHNGIDLPVPEGTPVHAVAPGTVLRIQRRGPGGLEVLVQHQGFVAIYSHLGSVPPLEYGESITTGEQLGLVGHTGVTYGPHLFFGILQSGRAVDPAPLLGVPMCKDATESPAQTLARGGRLPNTRHYLVLDLRLPNEVK
jgi:murein DD-endopeptidase MepM/ murein hydrolase activator NlpD